jgi:hypothetical protein
LGNYFLFIFLQPYFDWWLAQRGYNYADISAIDEAGMINELQRHEKGFRESGHIKHSHSWSIDEAAQLGNWL